MIHLLNAGEWLVGPIDRLVADAAHRVLEGVTVEDTVHVIARHGELLASYSLNQHQAPNEATITVVCERGTCRAELHRHRWRWMARPGEPWQKESYEGLNRNKPFVAQANGFLDAIDGRTEPVCSLSEAAHTLRCNLAARASAEDDTWKRTNCE